MRHPGFMCIRYTPDTQGMISLLKILAWLDKQSLLGSPFIHSNLAKSGT